MLVCLFVVTLVRFLQLVHSFGPFQFGGVLSHMFVQNDERVVLAIRKHEEREVAGVQSVKNIAKAELVSGGEPVHLVEPETAKQVGYRGVLPHDQCSLWNICQGKPKETKSGASWILILPNSFKMPKFEGKNFLDLLSTPAETMVSRKGGLKFV